MARDLQNITSAPATSTTDAEDPTHEGSDALPKDVHRHGREPADCLACAQDKERDLDAAAEDNAVREERGRVEDHVLPEVAQREDVQRVCAVRVEQVRNGGGAGDDHAEVDHPTCAYSELQKMRDGWRVNGTLGTYVMQATAPIQGMRWSFPTAHPTYPKTPNSMANMKTRRNSGSYIPRLRLDIQTTPKSFKGPETIMAKTMPTMPPRFVRP